MTRDAGTRDSVPRRRRASLGGRIVVAFTAVTVAAIALVSAAAFIGTEQGLSAQAAAARRTLSERAAEAASTAYLAAGGWDDADLGLTISIASGAGARVIVRDIDGAFVAATTGRGAGGGPGMMNGHGMGGAGGGSLVIAPVEANGSTVGSVSLIFSAQAGTAGRPVAWTWVGAAALTALILAAGAGWLITRMLTRPLGVITSTARAFAAGDRSARARLDTLGELGELAAAFDAAAEQVQLSERARRQLSADVAHELRTPLAALQAGLEELRDGLAPADPAALARLHDQTLRLGRVVTDLAQLSSADAARLTLRSDVVDLAEVAAQAADAHEGALRAAGVELTRLLDAGVRVSGDAHRLHQVVGNLLQNCARHCRPGDSVALTVRQDADLEPGRGVARLTVADTGPGIAAEDLPHVFTRFWRAGPGGGSGLGMAIVRALVEAHHGTVRVDSDGHRGTCVTIELPIAGVPL